jgi:hypothetical protein
MCRQVKCSSCAKATYAGCGRHVEQVLAGVPASQRCRCREQNQAKAKDGDKATRRRSWWPF